MRVAVIGGGVSGLGCAWRLAHAGLDVTLFEAAPRFGGHSNTVDISLEGQAAAVDTGFLVFNERTYPALCAMFDELGVETADSDMSFSVQLAHRERRLEWSGSNLDSVFAQRRNLFDPRFIGMLADIRRFNQLATAAADAAPEPVSLGDFLALHGFGAAFRDWYLLPMAACIWSCPTPRMLDFPLATFVRFCRNHGLLQVTGRPQWRTVRGGSRNYVDKLLAHIPQRFAATPVLSVQRMAMGGARPVRVRTAAGEDFFDEVVLACHSDQALAMLADADYMQRRLLEAIGYQQNRAVLHTDAACLPQARKAWAAWNYESAGGDAAQVCVHYLLNRLQPLPFLAPVLVSLNPLREPAPDAVLAEFSYAHPVFDQRAIDAQQWLPHTQGRGHVWLAGAWTGYGFHEDGLRSGLEVAAALIAKAQVRHAA
jgi:predicted NAD/FAD-binding protein